jgi:hypothetical protein
MATNRPLAMLAVLGGALALLLGLAVLLLPLLLPELSRSRDAVWGAVVLLLGLVLVTSAERLTGAPMLGVLCAGLLIGRLGVEVGQGRWRQLTAEEQQRLASSERWRKAIQEAASAAGRLLQLAIEHGAVIGTWLRQRRQPRGTGKLWVRPEPPTAQPQAGEAAAEEGPQAAPADAAAPSEATAPAQAAAPAEPEAPAKPAEEPVVVTSFEEIDALIEASDPEDAGQPEESDEAPAGDEAPPGDEDAGPADAPGRTG